MSFKQFKGLNAVIIISIFQLISFTGSAISGFGQMFYIWGENGKALTITFFFFVQTVSSFVFSPFVGIVVDRFNKKTLIMLADTGNAVITGGLLVISLLTGLNAWHLYLSTIFLTIFTAIHGMCLFSMIPLMVEQGQFARANSLLEIAFKGSNIFPPIMAGLLYTKIGLNWLFVIDLMTFALAILSMLFITIPDTPKSVEGQKAEGNFFHQVKYGFVYLRKKISLLYFTYVNLGVNSMRSFYSSLWDTYLLASSNNSFTTLGGYWSAFGIGGVIGAIALSTWGGPKGKKMYWMLGFMAITALFHIIGALVFNFTVLIMIGFLMCFMYVFWGAVEQSFWQSKVEVDLLGRVGAATGLISNPIPALINLIAGWLADTIFEPAMIGLTPLSKIFVPIFGTHKGSGMALLIFFSALLSLIPVAIGFANRTIREADSILPDVGDISPD